MEEMTVNKGPSKTTLENEISVQPSLWKTYIAVLAAHMYTVVAGMAASYSAPATVDMKRSGSRFIDLTDDQTTWIGSLLTTTCGAGSFLSGYLSFKLGRKAVLILMSTPFVISWLMIAYAPSMLWIYFGRMLQGLSFGVCAVATQAYVTEISPARIRGFLGTGFQLFFSIGTFIIILQGYVLRWSWLAVSGAAFVALSACLMYLMPESPEWLFRKSKKWETVQSLRFFHGEYLDTERELKLLAENINEQPKSSTSWRQFLDPTLYKPVLISMSLSCFQQTTGINVLISFTVEIFQNTGSSLDAQTSAVTFAAVQIIATLVSSVLIDRAGRRVLFITSGSLMSVSLCALGLYCYLDRCGYDLSRLNWIPLLSLIVYISFYALGFGPIPLVVASEMVPVSSRSTVLGIVLATASIVGFLMTKSFAFMVVHLGYYGVFWTYGVIASLGALFAWFFLPETKGRTINDINSSFMAK